MKRARFVDRLASVLARLFEACFGFVTGNHFPLPLSEQEEKEYLQGVQRGDIASRNMLVEHNLRLVAHIVKFDPQPSRCGRLNFNWKHRSSQGHKYL